MADERDAVEKDAGARAEGFRLGTPALVCRWRLAGRDLPLESRHLRALARRTVSGAPVPTPLVAWAKQHIEWTLRDGAARNPDGVLMIVVDEAGQAAMTVGPFEPLPAAERSAAALAARAERSRAEAAETGVAPETLWAVRGDELVWGAERDEVPSGAASLVADLARTLGMGLACDPELARAALRGAAPSGDGCGDEVFLASDEHGVVPAADASGPCAERLAAGYERLLESKRDAARRARR